jgi:hypothetical protein
MHLDMLDMWKMADGEVRRQLNIQKRSHNIYISLCDSFSSLLSPTRTRPTPMSAALTPVTLVGGTGLTGSAAVKALLASSHAFALTTLTRRPLEGESSNPSTTYTNKTFSDLFEAVKGDVATKGGVYVSCLGTTRAAAGGLDKQIRIDLDLNRDLVQKAKEDGASTVSLRPIHEQLGARSRSL